MFFTNLNREIVACILSFRKSRHKPSLESITKYGFSPELGGKMAAFWACACKLSWILLSPAQVQPRYGAGRKESSGTGLPITRSAQLTYQAYVTSFLQTSLILGFFSREIDQFQSRLARIGKEKNGSMRRWTYWHKVSRQEYGVVAQGIIFQFCFCRGFHL